jgi:hypothetical protein
MTKGIKFTTLLFEVLETDDIYNLTIVDLSEYHEKPDKPLFIIKVPGMQSTTSVPYNTNQLNVLNSHNLGVTLYTNNFSVLPDGVYEITQAICPHEEIFHTKFYLKDTLLKQRLYKFLGKKEACCDCENSEDLKRNLLDLHVLLLSAKSYAFCGDKNTATEMYKKANKILNRLEDAC